MAKDAGYKGRSYALKRVDEPASGRSLLLVWPETRVNRPGFPGGSII